MTDSPGRAELPSTRPRSLRRWSTIIGVGVGIAGVAFVVRTLIRDSGEVNHALSEARPLLLLLALAMAGLAMTGIGLAWHTTLRSLGANLGLMKSMRGYFVGQLGKYVPGGVWAVMGRGEWARSGGVSGATAYTSVVLSMGSAYLAALTLGAILLPLARSPGPAGNNRYLLVLFLLPVGFVILHPSILKWILRSVRKVSTRELAVGVPSWTRSSLIVLQQLPSWLLIGAVSVAIAAAFDTPGDPINLIWSSAMAWIVGFLALPTPGGIGVREAVFVALATSLPAGIAATVAIVARLLFISVDAAGAGITSALVSRLESRRETSY